MFFIKTFSPRLSIKLLKLFRLGQSTLRGQLYSEPYLGYPANERYPLNVSTPAARCGTIHLRFLRSSSFPFPPKPPCGDHSGRLACCCGLLGAGRTLAECWPKIDSALLVSLCAAVDSTGDRHLIQCGVNARPFVTGRVLVTGGILHTSCTWLVMFLQVLANC